MSFKQNRNKEFQMRPYAEDFLKYRFPGSRIIHVKGYNDNKIQSVDINSTVQELQNNHVDIILETKDYEELLIDMKGITYTTLTYIPFEIFRKYSEECKSEYVTKGKLLKGWSVDLSKDFPKDNQYILHTAYYNDVLTSKAKFIKAYLNFMEQHTEYKQLKNYYKIADTGLNGKTNYNINLSLRENTYKGCLDFETSMKILKESESEIYVGDNIQGYNLWYN
ncbi:MAG: hypothetical protein ACI3T9_06600 [Romboutsia timonensis]